MTLKDFCQKYDYLFIYGNGGIGRLTKEMLERNGVFVEAYIVSDTERKSCMYGDEVYNIDEWYKKYGKENSGVLIAVSEKYKDEIIQRLQVFDVETYLYVSGELCQEFRREMVPMDVTKLFESTEPVSRLFGYDRGMPIDRYYIEKFLCENSAKILNIKKTMEVGEDTYSKRFFGGAINDILRFDEGMDLTKPETLKKDHYDVFICTQVFNFIYDIKAAVYGAFSLLQTGGTMLATVAGNISPVSRSDMENYGHFWGFTYLGIKKIVEEIFGKHNVVVFPYGNAMAATAFIQGFAIEDFSSKAKIDDIDPDYAILESSAPWVDEQMTV